MKEIRLGFYKRYIGQDRYLTVEVVQKTVDESAEWQLDEKLTVIHRYRRNAGKVLFRIANNAPLEADLWQVKYDELPEEEWYEYFVAGMSEIHPNDAVRN